MLARMKTENCIMWIQRASEHVEPQVSRDFASNLINNKVTHLNQTVTEMKNMFNFRNHLCNLETSTHPTLTHHARHGLRICVSRKQWDYYATSSITMINRNYSRINHHRQSIPSSNKIKRSNQPSLPKRALSTSLKHAVWCRTHINSSKLHLNLQVLLFVNRI